MTKMLGAIDWIIISGYLVAVIIPSIWSRLRKKQDVEEYLIAKHSINWFVVAVAVFATLFSTVSFVSVPGEAFNYGLIYFAVAVLSLAMVPLAIHLFLRFFFNTPTFTAYEYLERRYDRKCRVLAAVVFLLIRLFYTGCVFYSAAVMFETMFGWSPVVVVVSIGIVTIFYAWLGGTRAVIFADLIQSFLIFLGVIAILYGVLHVVHFDLGAVFSFAHDHNHLFEQAFRADLFKFDVKERFNFYLLLLCIVFNPLISMSCDQMTIQRLLSGKNYEQAKRSVYASYLMGLPVILMLYGIGLCLFYYYRSGMAPIPDGISGDQALAYFVLTKLPSPLPGLIVAALLSAMMSTIAGAVSSLVTVFWKDILLSFSSGFEKEENGMRWCRGLTLVFGAVTILFAVLLLLLGQGLRTTVMEVVSICSALWPVLFSAFLYGVLTRWVSARAIFISLLIGGAVAILVPFIFYYGVPETYRWSFQWCTLPGQIVSLVLPPLLSLFFPNRKNVDGLVLWKD